MVQYNVLVLLALALLLLLGLPLLALLVELALHILEHILDPCHSLHAHHVEGEIIKVVSLHLFFFSD